MSETKVANDAKETLRRAPWAAGSAGLALLLMIAFLGLPALPLVLGVPFGIAAFVGQSLYWRTTHRSLEFSSGIIIIPIVLASKPWIMLEAFALALLVWSFLTLVLGRRIAGRLVHG